MTLFKARFAFTRTGCCTKLYVSPPFIVLIIPPASGSCHLIMTLRIVALRTETKLNFIQSFSLRGAVSNIPYRSEEPTIVHCTGKLLRLVQGSTQIK